MSTDLSTDAEKAKAKIENWEKERPKSYKSAYSQSIDSIVEELLSMKFDGNIENDPLFNLTRDESIKQGLLAMEDTLGKALSMTGGYANSYAQSAAQGAYAKELSGYTQLIPELYEAAYDRFSDERESVKDAVKLLRSLDDSDFDRYTDMMKQYLSEGEMLFDNYNTLSKEEFDRFLDYASLLQKAAK